MLAAAREGGSEHGRSGFAVERRCYEPASAEQRSSVHAAEPSAVPAAVLIVVLVAVQDAALPAALAAD